MENGGASSIPGGGGGGGWTYDCKSVSFTESDRLSTARQLC